MVSVVHENASMTGKRNWKYRPAVWAIAFAAFDVVWLLLIHLVAWITPHDDSDFTLSDHFISDHMIAMWNAAHKPIRIIIEPILFPVVTFHPPTPSGAVFLIYQGLCVLQFVLIGYIIGLGVSHINRVKNRAKNS